ncbi:hypothetical protein ACJJTC_008232 [Scirpophaga incertulas]
MCDEGRGLRRQVGSERARRGRVVGSGARRRAPNECVMKAEVCAVRLAANARAAAVWLVAEHGAAHRMNVGSERARRGRVVGSGARRRAPNECVMKAEVCAVRLAANARAAAVWLVAEHGAAHRMNVGSERARRGRVVGSGARRRAPNECVMKAEVCAVRLAANARAAAVWLVAEHGAAHRMNV